MNGKMLEELREMAREDSIDSDACLKLIIAGVAELRDNIERVRASSEERANSIELLTEKVDSLASYIHKLRAEIKTRYDPIVDSPLVVFSMFLKKYKWAGPVLFAVVLVFLNLWFVDGFRQAALSFFGVPDGVIGILNPTPTP